MGTREYLERIKTENGLTSEYALAKTLGIKEGALAHYRHGRRTMDNYTATRVAEMLHLDPMEVIATAEAERETNETKRDYWNAWLKKCARSAPAGMLAIVGLSYIMTIAYISPEDGMMSASFDNVLRTTDYALWTVALLVLLAQLGKRTTRQVKAAPALRAPQAST